MRLGYINMKTVTLITNVQITAQVCTVIRAAAMFPKKGSVGQEVQLVHFIPGKPKLDMIGGMHGNASDTAKTAIVTRTSVVLPRIARKAKYSWNVRIPSGVEL